MAIHSKHRLNNSGNMRSKMQPWNFVMCLLSVPQGVGGISKRVGDGVCGNTSDEVDTWWYW